MYIPFLMVDPLESLTFTLGISLKYIRAILEGPIGDHS